jgi:hypothetical protein
MDAHRFTQLARTNDMEVYRMPPRTRCPWLPRVFFLLAITSSTALFVMVFAAPALDNGAQTPSGAARAIALFARDVTVRRTSVAGAIGLAATACIFFRTAGEGRSSSRRGRPPRLPPPRNIAGA